jgi:hypothetical protein
MTSTQKTPQSPTPAPAPSAGPQKLLMAGVVIILATIGFIVWLIVTDAGSTGNRNQSAASNEAAPAPPAPTPGGGRLLPSGLRIETVREGTGPLATPADVVHFRYELRRFGGEVIESNLDAPRAAVMPVSGLVPGFIEGLTHMRAGGEARFWIPPQLGYGDSPPAGLNPTDTLEFRVRLERIAPPRAAPATGADNGSAGANQAAGAPAP